MTGATKAKKRPPPPIKSEGDFWELDLYVTGKTWKTAFAVENLKRICREYLKDRHRITVIDIQANPEIAFRDQIVMTPTTVRKLPLPTRRVYGDLSRREKVLQAFDILTRSAAA